MVSTSILLNKSISLIHTRFIYVRYPIEQTTDTTYILKIKKTDGDFLS